MKRNRLWLMACGVLLGSYGVRILSSRDAKKVYTHTTAAVLRMKDEVLRDVETVRENLGDIAAEARDINEQRQKEYDARVIEDARAVLAEAEAGGSADPKAFSDLDWEFHSLIIRRCENHYIRSIMHDNNQNLRRFQRLSVRTLNDLKESTAQHLNLLALIRRRDPDALSAAIEDHVRWAAGLIRTAEQTR